MTLGQISLGGAKKAEFSKFFVLNAEFWEVSCQNWLGAEVPNRYFGSRVTTRAELNEIEQYLTAVPKNADTQEIFFALFPKIDLSRFGCFECQTTCPLAFALPHSLYRAYSLLLSSLYHELFLSHFLAVMVYRKISCDLKDAALGLWDLGWEEDEIMCGLIVSRSSLYRWKKLFEESGSTTRPPSPLVGRPRTITRAVLTTCYNIYKKQPDLYLDELRWHLAIHHNVVISISALQKNLEDVCLTSKLLHKIVRERDI
jgi:transposase